MRAIERTRSMNGPLRLTMSVGAALLLAGCSDPWPEQGIDPGNQAKRVIGEEIYFTHCAECHGERLEGQPNWRKRGPDGRLPAPPHDASGHTWHHDDETRIAIVRDGMTPPHVPKGYESNMPAYGEILSEDEIRAVLAWIVSTWPEEIVKARREMIERYQRQ